VILLFFLYILYFKTRKFVRRAV